MDTDINPPTAGHLFSPESVRDKISNDDAWSHTMKRSESEDPETLEVIENPAETAVPLTINGNGNKEEVIVATEKADANPFALPTIGNETNITREQIKYCEAIMRNLKKHRDAKHFLHPVDFVKFNLPDYPLIIKHPMDFETISHKLSNNEYVEVEDFVNDVRLVFKNCYKYNGPESPVSLLCLNVQSAFEKSRRNIPPATMPQSESPKPAKAKGSQGSRAGSQAQSLLRMAEEGRPKREIHPPRSKDYPEPMTKRGSYHRKSDVQMQFCRKAVAELKKTKYTDINYPFLEPVDWKSLNIPDYPKIVKHPMDLSTIEHKLDDGEYDTPEEFESDVHLMFNNCYLYNDKALPIVTMAKSLEKVFDDKWKQRPQPTPIQTQPEDEDEDMVESEEEDQNDRIAELERHLATITQQIASIKNRKKPERGAAKAREKKPAKQVGDKRKRPPAKRASTVELPEFTFEQKKDLSERINNLTGDKLNTVVSIIQSSMPNLDGQGQEEIVLDIDALDRKTLHRLHEFVTGKSLIPQKKVPKKARATSFSRSEADRKAQDHDNSVQRFGSGYNGERRYESSSASGSESSSDSDSDDSDSSSD